MRDRDYFFTPAFVFFALVMGLGISRVLSYVGGELSKWKVKEFVNKFAVSGLSAIFLLAPLMPLERGLHSPTNQRNNYIPYDYAYNILNSCDKDAIIFTNGDNDTFPLWFIQEVEKVRTDVRVINLSLLNTDWYILQLKNKMNVPISLSYDQIKWVNVRLRDGRTLPRPKEKYYDKLRGTQHYLFAYYDPGTKKPIRVQDLMIEDIIFANEWKYPIYFSSTVPPTGRLNLNDHLKKAGFGMKLVPEEGKSMLDADRYHQLLGEVYRYRGLNDMKVYKNENAIGMLVSYPEMFIELSNYYLSSEDKEKAKAELEKSLQIYPDYYRTYSFLAKIYKEEGKVEEAENLLKKVEEHLKTLYDFNPQLLYLQYMGLFYISQRKTREAEDIFYQAYQESPDNAISVRALSDLYIMNGKYRKSEKVLERWLKDHPGDQAVSNVLQRLRTRQ